MRKNCEKTRHRKEYSRNNLYDRIYYIRNHKSIIVYISMNSVETLDLTKIPLIFFSCEELHTLYLFTYDFMTSITLLYFCDGIQFLTKL
jgi:hypothetical protein